MSQKSVVQVGHTSLGRDVGAKMPCKIVEILTTKHAHVVMSEPDEMPGTLVASLFKLEDAIPPVNGRGVLTLTQATGRDDLLWQLSW